MPSLRASLSAGASSGRPGYVGKPSHDNVALLLYSISHVPKPDYATNPLAGLQLLVGELVSEFGSVVGARSNARPQLSWKVLVRLLHYTTEILHHPRFRVARMRGCSRYDT